MPVCHASSVTAAASDAGVSEELHGQRGTPNGAAQGHVGEAHDMRVCQGHTVSVSHASFFSLISSFLYK